MIILKSVVSRNTLGLKSKDNRLLLTVYGRHSAILVICNIETQGCLLVKGIHFCSLASITVFLGFSILILKMKELTTSKVSCKWIELPC